MKSIIGMEKNLGLENIYERLNRGKVLQQIFAIITLFCAFWDIALISSSTDKSAMSVVVKSILLNSLWIFVGYFWMRNLFITRIDLNIKNKIKNNKEIIIFIVVFVTSSLSILDLWLLGDGYIYYSELLKKKDWNFENFFGMGLCGHASSFFSMWLLLGEYLCPDNAYGVRLILILMATLTVVAFWGIIREIYSSCDKIVSVLLSAVFAFNPYVWGGLGEINIDFPLLCALIWLIYFGIKEYTLLQMYAGILLCFSKESGVFIYAGYMLGWLLANIYENRSLKYNKLMQKIVDVRFCLNCFGGFLWLMYFFYSRGKSSWVDTVENTELINVTALHAKMNAFSAWFPYMLHKIKEILFINYGWIYFLLLVVIVMVFWLAEEKYAKPKLDRKTIWGMFFAFFAFYNFSLWYVTWPNYRYLIPMAFFQSVVLVLFICGVIRSIKWQRLFLTIMLGVTLLSNFSPDILSKYFFYEGELGNGKQISTHLFSQEGGYAVIDEDKIKNRCYGDLAITNRQYVYRGKCINSLLNEIEYDEDTLLVYPMLFGYKDQMYLYGRHIDYSQKEIYVNKNSYLLNNNNLEIDLSENKNYIPYHAVYLDESDKLTEDIFTKYNRIYYVYFCFDETYDNSVFLNDYDILEEFSITKNATRCNVYRIK